MPRAAALLTMVVLCALVPWPAGAQPTNDVVFVSNRSGHDEIWTTSSGDPTGSLFQVTNFGDGALREPRWSPDGQWIAFVRWMPGVSASLEAWVVRPDGTNPTQLTSFPGTSNYVFQVDFGADSDWVYFIKVFPAIRSEIWRVSITSGALEPVNLRPNTNFQSFEVSSDGRYRVEMRENGCCSTPSQHTVVHDLAQGTETTVLPNDGAAEWRPRFNSDASRFAWFQTKRDIGIWVMDRDGNNRAHLTFGNDGHATWSPDDTQLLYASGSNLHLLSLTSGITSVFLASTFQDFAPDWRDAGPTNSAPVADAGMDQVVECTVTGGMPTVTLPMGTHTITLTVMDVAGQMATDTVTITVADTTAPTVTTALTPLGNGDDHDRKGKDDDSGKDEETTRATRSISSRSWPRPPTPATPHPVWWPTSTATP